MFIKDFLPGIFLVTGKGRQQEGTVLGGDLFGGKINRASYVRGVGIHLYPMQHIGGQEEQAVGRKVIFPALHQIVGIPFQKIIELIKGMIVGDVPGRLPYIALDFGRFYYADGVSVIYHGGLTSLPVRISIISPECICNGISRWEGRVFQIP